jgi:DNA repair protein RecN (Recombination protein N)
MLSEILIRNLAIIDHLQVRFAGGFNVLTGETGAGKSIIIDAVSLLLGDRARPELIRTDAEEATVEARFDLSSQPGLCRELAAAGFEGSEELLVRRVVAHTGKNRVYLNGSLATLAQLQSFTGRLVTIYGQHEHQSLQRSETHLGLLDVFGGLVLLVQAYADRYSEREDLIARLDRLDQTERERQQRLDLLAFQCREIEGVAPREGEDRELEAERLVLQHAERLAAATGGGFEILYGGDDAVCGRLDGVAAELAALAGVDPRLGDLAEALRAVLYTTEDVAGQLRDYLQRFDFEPERQDQVEGRLAQLAGLKRKYGATLEAVLAFKTGAHRELEVLTDVTASRELLGRQAAAAEVALHQAGHLLGSARREAAGRLAQAVEHEFHDLAMVQARFEARLSALAEPGSRGFERCEFFLAPNPGEAPKPLARIASGGELSRIMLALRRAIPAAEGVATLIFDEVDAGIGGVAATAVGEKLHKVAQGLQVLCITHLPQVAAFADHHFRVEKLETGGRTVTSLTELAGESRVGEMARMLGGARVTERTLEHARELIDQSARS